MKAAIAIDAWKFATFERHLKDAGFRFTKGPGVTADTLLLTVETDNAVRLESTVRAANAEAVRIRS